MLLFLIYQSLSICKTRKKISNYRRYTCNLSKSDYNLLVNYIYTKIVIVSIIYTNFFRY